MDFLADGRAVERRGSMGSTNGVVDWGGKRADYLASIVRLAAIRATTSLVSVHQYPFIMLIWGD